MDNLSKGLLLVVAVAVSAIALKLYAGSIEAKCGPTYGDFMSLGEAKDGAAREEAVLNLYKSLPMIRVQGGDIDADVTGSVSID